MTDDFLEEYGQDELGFREYAGTTPRKTVGNLNALDAVLRRPVGATADTGERHARFYVPRSGYTQQKPIRAATTRTPEAVYQPPGPPVRWQIDPFSTTVTGLLESPVGVAAGMTPGDRTDYVTTPILGAKIATAPITAANFATYIREGIPAALTAMQGFKYQQIPGQPYTPPPGPPEGERDPIDEVIGFLNDAGEAAFNALSWPVTWFREENAKVRAKQLRDIAQGKQIGVFSQGALIGNLTALLFGSERLSWERIREKAEAAGVSPLELAAELYDMDPNVTQAIFYNPMMSDQAVEELAKGMPFSRNPGVNFAMELSLNMGVFVAEAALVEAITGGTGTPAVLARLGTLGWLPQAARGAYQTGRVVIARTPLEAVPWTLGKAWKLYKAQTVGGAAVRGGEWGLKQVGVWLGDEELVQEANKWLWETPFSSNPGFQLIDAFSVHPIQKMREARHGILQAGDRNAPFVRVSLGVPEVSVGGRSFRPLNTVDVGGVAVKVDARDARGLHRTIGNVELPELQRGILDKLDWEPEVVRAFFDRPGSDLTIADLKNGLIYMALATARRQRGNLDVYFMSEMPATERMIAWVDEHLHDAIKIIRGQMAGSDDSMTRLFREEFWQRAELDDASATGAVPMPGTYNGEAALENFAAWLRASKLVREAHQRLAIDGQMVVPGLDPRPNVARLRATKEELAKAFPAGSARVTNEWVQRVAIHNPNLRERLSVIPKNGFTRKQIDAFIDTDIAGELKALGADVAGEPTMLPIVDADATSGQITRGLGLRGNSEAVKRLLPIVKGEADVPPGSPPREIVKYVADAFYNSDMTQAMRLPAEDIWRRAIDHFSELYFAAAENGRLAGVLDDFARYGESRTAEGRMSPEAQGVLNDAVTQLRVALFERVPDDAPTTVRTAAEWERAQLTDPEIGLVTRIEKYLSEPALRHRAAVVNQRPVLLDPDMVIADLERLDLIAGKIAAKPPDGLARPSVELLGSPDVHPLSKVGPIREAIDAGAKVSAKDRAFLEGMGEGLERLRGPVQELLGEGTEPTPANITRAGQYVADTEAEFGALLRDLKHRADASMVNLSERTWSPDFRVLLEDINQYGRNKTAARPNAHLWPVKPTTEVPVVPEAPRPRATMLSGADEVPELGLGAEDLGPAGMRVVMTDENGIARAAVDVVDDRANSKAWIVSRVIPDTREGGRPATTQAIVKAINQVDASVQGPRLGFGKPAFIMRINDADGARIALDIKASTYGDRVRVFVGGSAREANVAALERFARANKALPIEALDNMEQLNAAAELPLAYRSFVVVEEGQPAYLMVIGPDDVALPPGLAVMQQRPPAGTAPLFTPKQAAFDLQGLDWMTGEQAALRLADEQLLRELHATTVSLNERVFMRDNPPVTFERPAVTPEVTAPVTPEVVPGGMTVPVASAVLTKVPASDRGAIETVLGALDERGRLSPTVRGHWEEYVASIDAAQRLEKRGRVSAANRPEYEALVAKAGSQYELMRRALSIEADFEVRQAKAPPTEWEAAPPPEGVVSPPLPEAAQIPEGTTPGVTPRVTPELEAALARRKELVNVIIERQRKPPRRKRGEDEFDFNRRRGDEDTAAAQAVRDHDLNVINPLMAREPLNIRAARPEDIDPRLDTRFFHEDPEAWASARERALALPPEQRPNMIVITNDNWRHVELVDHWEGDVPIRPDGTPATDWAGLKDRPWRPAAYSDLYGTGLSRWPDDIIKREYYARVWQYGDRPEAAKVLDDYRTWKVQSQERLTKEFAKRDQAKKKGAQPEAELFEEPPESILPDWWEYPDRPEDALIKAFRAAYSDVAPPEPGAAASPVVLRRLEGPSEAMLAARARMAQPGYKGVPKPERYADWTEERLLDEIAGMERAIKQKKPGVSSASEQARLRDAQAALEQRRSLLGGEAEAAVRPTQVAELPTLTTVEAGGSPITFPDPFDPTTKVPSRFKVVEIGALLSSDQPGFPAELQWRQRGKRIASEEQITKLAKDFDPDLAMRYESGAEGTPVVGPDNTIISGNGRIAAMRRMSAAQHDAYLARLKERAAEFGIDPDELARVNEPVLVREIPTEYMTPEMAYGLNVATGGQSITEGAIYLASRISVEDVKALDLGAAGTVQSALASAKGAEFVQRMLRKLTEQERRSLVDAKGNLNKQGIDLFSAALFGKVMRTPEAQRIVATFFESADPELGRVRQGVLEALGQIAEAQALMDEGLRHPLDIGEALAGAVAKLIDIRQSGQDPQVVLKTAGMFTQDEPLVLWLAEVLDAAKSQKEIGIFLRSYAQAVIDSPDPNQIGMFGNVQPVLADVLRPAVDELNAARNQLWNERVAKDSAQAGLDLTAMQRPSNLQPLPRPPGLTGEVELKPADVVTETPAITASAPAEVPEQVIAEKAPAPAVAHIGGEGWVRSLATDGKRADAVVLDIPDPRDRAVVAAIIEDSAGFRANVLSMARAYEQSGGYGYIQGLATAAARGDIWPAEWVLLKALQYDKAGRKRPWRVTPAGALELPGPERLRKAAILDEFIAQADALDGVAGKVSLSETEGAVALESMGRRTVIYRSGPREALTAEQFANETGFTPSLLDQATEAERIAAAVQRGDHVLFTTEDAHLAAKVSERVGGPGDTPTPGALPRVIEANNPTEAEIIATLEARRLKLEEMRATVQNELRRLEAEQTPPAPVGDPVPAEPVPTTLGYFPPELRAAWEQLHAGAVADVMGVPDPHTVGDVVDAIRALEAGWYGAIDDPALAMRLRDYLLGMARRGLEDGKRTGARKRASSKTNIVKKGADDEQYTEEFGNFEAEWEDVQRQLIEQRVVVEDPALPPLSGWLGTAYKLTKPPSKSKTTGGGLSPRLEYDDFLRRLDDVVPGLAEELVLGRRQDIAGRIRDTWFGQSLDMAFGARPEARLQAESISRFQAEVLDMLRASGTYTTKDIEQISGALKDVVYAWRNYLLQSGLKPTGFTIYRRPSLVGPDQLNTIARETLEQRNGGILPSWAEGLDFSQLWRHADNRFRAWLEKQPGGWGQYISNLYDSRVGREGSQAVRLGAVGYYLFRFLLDVRWLALEATEGPLLTLGRAGPVATARGMGIGRRPQPMFFPKEMADFVKRDWAYWMSIESPGYVLRQRERYLLAILEHEQPRYFVDALTKLAQRDPELSKTIALMGDDVNGWLRRLDEDFTAAMSRDTVLPPREADRVWRPFLERGVLDEAEFKEIVSSGRYTPLPEVEAMISETAGNPVLQNLYMRLQVVNQQLWNDIAGTVFGQADRSNFQRLMNHPLIYWPISYQIKATKWLGNMLLDRFAGVDTGAAPAVVMQWTVDQHKELMQTDPYYAAAISGNETLLFLAGMILPITPFDIGVGLSPWVRLVIDNTYNRNAVAVGPGYTFFQLLPRLVREQSKEGSFAQGVPGLDMVVQEAQRWFPYTIPIAPIGEVGERQKQQRISSRTQAEALKGFENAPGELEPNTPGQVPRRLQP